MTFNVMTFQIIGYGRFSTYLVASVGMRFLSWNKRNILVPKLFDLVDFLFALPCSNGEKTLCRDITKTGYLSQFWVEKQLLIK